MDRVRTCTLAREDVTIYVFCSMVEGIHAISIAWPAVSMSLLLRMTNLFTIVMLVAQLNVASRSKKVQENTLLRHFLTVCVCVCEISNLLLAIS